MKLSRSATSRSVALFVGDSRSNAGAGLTGLTYATAGLACCYKADTAASVTAVTLVTMTVGTWVSGGLVEISASALPGWYELGLPNAALATGKSVTVYLSGAANAVGAAVLIELDAVDYQDAAGLGLSRLDAAVSTRAAPGAAMALTAAAYQVVAREIYGTSGAVWFVSTSGSDTTGDGLTWATAYATPTKAASVAAAGDLILMGSMFDLGEATFAPAAGVNVRGSGPGTGLTGVTSGSLAVISGTSEFRDFAIVGHAYAGSFGFFQLSLSVASGANAVLRNVPITGQTDCIYFNGVTGATLRAYACPLTTLWDFAFVDGGGVGAGGNVLELHDCPCVSAGPPLVSESTYFSTGIGISGSPGSVVRIYRGSVSAEGNGVSQTAVHADSGTVCLYDTAVRTAGSGTLLDFKQESSGAIVVTNTAYDPAKVSGAVTVAPVPINKAGQIAAGAVADLTTARLGKLDSLTFTTAGKVDATAAGYATGQDPATLVWAATTRRLSDATNLTSTGAAVQLSSDGHVKALDELGGSLAVPLGTIGSNAAAAVSQTTASALGAAVLDVAASGHATAGTVGAKIGGAQQAGSPVTLPAAPAGYGASVRNVTITNRPVTIDT